MAPVNRNMKELDPKIVEIAKAVQEIGGRAIVVGGWVRDHLLGICSKDVDVEVFGLDAGQVETLLAGFGKVHAVGRAFGVFQIAGVNADFSLPRRDSKQGRGHRGFEVRADPSLDFAEASRRRDLTVNSIGIDPLTAEVLDPHHGRRDLEDRVLRATDPAHFAEDPLRGMRVAQLAARLEMTPDDTLIALCRNLDLSELPGERMFDELKKLLLRAAKPSIGLEVLAQTDQIRFFPELDALRGVPQDPQWHPEGDVWVHTLMVVDAAARLRKGDHTTDNDDLALMLGALCHDLGKPATTTWIDGRIRSRQHDTEGVPPTRALLNRMRAPGALVEQVVALVEHHLTPALFIRNGASPKGYRRLARKLERAGVDIGLLVRVARADHLGRTTEDALAGRFDAGDAFLAAARDCRVERAAPRDVVLGRHLIERGLRPGPGFAPIIQQCREVQDETGWTEPKRILDRVLDDPTTPRETIRHPRTGTRTSEPVHFAGDALRPLTDEELKEWAL